MASPFARWMRGKRARSRVWSGSELDAQVREVVADLVGLEREEIAPHVSLTDDLGVDSLDLADLVVDLETEFGITIPEHEHANLHTCEDVVRLTLACIAERDRAERAAAESPPPVCVRILRSSGGKQLVRSLIFSPYAAQTIVEDALRAGPGARLEVTVPDDTADAVLAHIEEALARPRAAGVAVGVRREAAAQTMPPTGTLDRSAALCQARRPSAAVQVLANIGELLHAVERERALTAVHMASGGRCFGPQLEAERAETDHERRSLRSVLDAAIGTLPEGVHLRGAALCHVDPLDDTRRRADRLAAAPRAILEEYSRTTKALLACAELLPPALEDRELAYMATASLAWLRAKEEASRERAEVATAFVRDAADGSAADAADWLSAMIATLDRLKEVEDIQAAMGLDRAARVVSIRGEHTRRAS